MRTIYFLLLSIYTRRFWPFMSHPALAQSKALGAGELKRSGSPGRWAGGSFSNNVVWLLITCEDDDEVLDGGDDEKMKMMVMMIPISIKRSYPWATACLKGVTASPPEINTSFHAKELGPWVYRLKPSLEQVSTNARSQPFDLTWGLWSMTQSIIRSRCGNPFFSYVFSNGGILSRYFWSCVTYSKTQNKYKYIIFRIVW